MRKSYIASKAEAINLHNGTQSAIVVKMKLPKWCKRFELQGGRRKDPTCYSLVDLNENNARNINEEYLTLMDIAPYQISQEVYVRETIVCNALGGAIYKAGGKVYGGRDLADNEYIDIDYLDKSHRGFVPLCKEKHARTRFKIVSCEAVRVQDLTDEQVVNIASGLHNHENYSQAKRDTVTGLLIRRFGQTEWDNNHFIWYYKIENI